MPKIRLLTEKECKTFQKRLQDHANILLQQFDEATSEVALIDKTTINDIITISDEMVHVKFLLANMRPFIDYFMEGR